MPGQIVHFELPSKDADRASSFWSDLFGWQIAGAMEDFDYRMFQAGEQQAGAVYPDADKGGSGVIVYFDTDDIDATIAKVRSLGGTAEDKRPVPTHGWFAPCTDTEGNSFNLWQPDENAA
jgi:uncharacterized protein